LILYGKASVDEAMTIRHVFEEFSNLSSQVPNFQKSAILFTKIVDDHTKAQLKSIFLVPGLQPNIMHLGHPN